MDFETELLEWSAAEEASTAIRRAVFQDEQGIAAALDLDGRDPQCWHIVASAAGRAVGVARLDGTHLQRVAVLPEFRGRGVGQHLIQGLVEVAAAKGFDEVVADAQATSVPIFRRLGFTISDEQTFIAGVSHRHVRLALPAGNT